MSFAKSFTAAPEILPFLNLGCGFDIPTGSYMIGKHGESLLNGGLSYLTGIAGGGNKFKSTILWYMLLTVLDRYQGSEGVAYDTEMSLAIKRLYQLAASMENIGGVALGQEGRLTVTSAVEYSGNKFYELFKEIATNREQNPKEYMRTSPFLDHNGNNLRFFTPNVTGVDSLSNFSADATIKMQNDNEIGDSGRNTEAMRASLIKTQLLMEMPRVTAATGNYVLFSAHVGEGIQMDPYAPNAKKLQHLAQNYKFKNVPEKFTFLMNNCWYADKAETMINQTTKAPEFPRNSDDDMKGDTDLNRIYLKNLRAKSGPTGMPMELIVSQSEGLLPGLTALNHLKSFKFGMGGHDRSYFNELLPDVALSRTTVRGKLDQNYKLRRAMEISMELCQIYNMWHDYDQKLVVAPAELFATLKEKGYNWDQLLETRGYWTFDNDSKDHKRPFLSTQDLLKMRVGDYHPYWMK